MDNIDLLLNEFGPAVYSFIISRIGRCDDVDDIYQTVFLRLFEKKPKFTDKRSVRAWLFKTARNCTVDLINSRKRTTELTEDIAVTDQSDIFEIIGSLPEIYRDVIYLFYQEDMSVKEISEVTGLSPGAVKTRLRRARIVLQEELK